MRDFQTASTMDPGLERIIKEKSAGEGYGRKRAQTYSKSILDRAKQPQVPASQTVGAKQYRERSSSFTHLRSPKFQPKAAINQNMATELFNAVRDEKKKSSVPNTNHSVSSSNRTTSLCGDLPSNLSQFYEVLYLGKIKVSHKRAPPTFIDEAVKKITNKTRKQDLLESDETASLDSSLNLDKNCCHAEDSVAHPLARNSSPIPIPRQGNKSPNEHNKQSQHEQQQHQAQRSMSLCDVVQSVTAKPQHPPAEEVQQQPQQTSCQNKVMLMQIGRCELRLISPDSKQVFLRKSFREVSHCSCGLEEKLNFGFICKEVSENGSTGYVGYILQCDSKSVVEDIMQGLKSAFFSAHETARKERAEQQCANCPMVWFNGLCSQLEGLPGNKAQSVLLRKVEGLGEKESSGILAKMQGAETTDIDEQNQILMMLLRASCEVKQDTHQHSSTTLTEKPPAISPNPTHESAISEAAKKAKRSLAESFNGIIRRRASMVESAPQDSSVVNNTTTSTSIANSSSSIVNTNSINNNTGQGMVVPPLINIERSTPVKMPHPLSVTNAERRSLQATPHESAAACSPAAPGGANFAALPVRSPLQPLTPDKHVAFKCELPSPVTGSSMGGRQRARTVGSAGGETMKRELARKRLARLATQTLIEEEETKHSQQPSPQPSPQVSIFKKTGAKSPHCDVITSRQHIFNKVTTPGKHKRADSKDVQPRNYRELWRTAIKQQILLNRMEKENRIMQEHEEVLAVKRSKLDYDDLVPSLPQELVGQWETVLSQGVQCRRSEIRKRISQGVCKGKRGEIWGLIVTQSGENTPPPTEEFSSKLSEWEKGYEELKSQLTPHQHAILIDLGRTFPSHGYFAGAPGAGQLGMFNLLKSYSILDPEVGYCQGLPFLVGLLLMHIDEEEEAFNILKYIMFNLNLRNMFKPDMTELQVSMYQLTRLIFETHPALYKLLDRLCVDASLYATPWFLTLFAANFPLGFVARVMDLLIMDGKSVIIKIGICLLLQASNSLLECDSLEEVMNIIKTELPRLPKEKLEDVIKQAASLNVSRQLKFYEVEYYVIQEDITLKESGKGEAYKLKQENTKMVEKISMLETEAKSYQQTVALLNAELAEQCAKMDRLQADKLAAELQMKAERQKRLECEQMANRLLDLMNANTSLPSDIREYFLSTRRSDASSETTTAVEDDTTHDSLKTAAKEEMREVNGNVVT